MPTLPLPHHQQFSVITITKIRSSPRAEVPEVFQQNRPIAEIQTETLPRTGVKELELQMAARFERIDGKINLLQWMLALIIGGVASLILKAFLG
ncbi:MAG: hypothetical protein M3436_02735 [Pseudomonadota bacterium]|nr:hypothetical protein [Pseudomonadota bacterium]